MGTVCLNILLVLCYGLLLMKLFMWTIRQKWLEVYVAPWGQHFALLKALVLKLSKPVDVILYTFFEPLHEKKCGYCWTIPDGFWERKNMGFHENVSRRTRESLYSSAAKQQVCLEWWRTIDGICTIISEWCGKQKFWNSLWTSRAATKSAVCPGDSETFGVVYVRGAPPLLIV